MQKKNNKTPNEKLSLFKEIHNAWDFAFNDLNTILNKYQISNEDIEKIKEIESGMIMMYHEACG